MKTISITLILISTLILGCNKSQKLQNTTKSIVLDSLQRKTNRITIQNSTHKIPKILKDDANFEALSKNIDTLNTISFALMEANVISINENIEELIETLPKEYKNKSILSRLNEMYTYSKDVAYRITKQRKDTAVLNKKASKIIIGYNHLLTQIDETTFKLPEDFKKELEREKEIKKDTIAVEPLF
ncbi:hypothetical protein [Aquimarina agarilytica]|uniref:hypothetical protein n=1 Tax=Aquimarina agarilytica TaxID=1087449 RepID=UPI0002890BF6|nr:hypothetical protein [Aquimarina agarilytica]